MENENSSFANILIPFLRSCSQHDNFFTYDKLYTNQLKQKVKVSKVIMEGNV